MNVQPDRYKVASILAIVFSGLLAACATSKPELTSSSLPIVKISVDQAQQDESLPLLVNAVDHLSDQRHSTQAVRWGGTITDIQNLSDQITVLEIVSRPLYRSGRPAHNDKTSGRFVAIVKEFLDPEIVKVRRDITVTGSLIGRQSGKVGQSDYVFPVLESETFTFWKKLTPKAPPHFSHWNDYPRHYRHRHDPFWSPWPFHRHPSRKRR